MGEKRFVVLDGMRGIAAAAVLLTHIGGLPAALVPGGYLAVDFFFALSGFVLMHAYGDSDLGLLGFLRVRAIRLYPLYLAGIVLGGVALVLLAGASARQVSAAAALGGLFLPTPFVFSGPEWVRGFLYPLDPAAWSLLFELIANAVWFPLRRRLAGVVGIAALAACAVLFVAAYVAYDGLGGGSDWPTVWGGFGRVFFSFLAGALTYRVWRRAAWRPRTPSWLPPMVLVVFLAFPIGRIWIDGPIVMFLVPPLIYVGACCAPPAVRLVAAAHRTLGDASYAVYTLHFAILTAGGAAAQYLKQQLGVAHPYLATTPLTIAAVFAAALWLDRVYDRPVRRWLSSVSNTKRAPEIAPANP